MKKFSALILAITVVVACFFACDKKDEKSPVSAEPKIPTLVGNTYDNPLAKIKVTAVAPCSLIMKDSIIPNTPARLILSGIWTDNQALNFNLTMTPPQQGMSATATAMDILDIAVYNLLQQDTSAHKDTTTRQIVTINNKTCAEIQYDNTFMSMPLRNKMVMMLNNGYALTAVFTTLKSLYPLQENRFNAVRDSIKLY